MKRNLADSLINTNHIVIAARVTPKDGGPSSGVINAKPTSKRSIEWI